jgi:alpha-glucosidase (family GH31 glycosyl hydrolase)
MKKSLVLLLFACILAGCSDGGSNDQPPVPPWPEWAFHHWVWEDESTQESAIALIDGYIQRDIPVGAIIIDSPWETGYNTFEWDTTLFPDPQGMIDYFHSKGVRVFLWIVSGINVDVTDLYQYAADHDYFLKTSAESGPKVVSWWKGEGSFIDYFNPEAVEWWHSLMDKSLDMGIDGWKCDGLDFQSMAAPYSPGRGGEFERIEYSHAYYRDFFDYSREKLGDDRIITARPVDNYGIPLGGEEVSFAPRDINWAGWVGDQDANFGGLKAALMNMYYSSEIGYIAFGSDIGGYRENDTFPPQMRSKELLLRWAQLGAFCPIMENGGGGIHHPWAFDQEAVDIYRTFVNLHYAMIPYLMEEGAKAFEAGESLMTFFDDVEYHYLLGPDILVAPMLEEGTSRTVQFPADSDWVYLFDKSKTYTGGSTETLTIPLDEFPVFLRDGSEIAGTLTAG